MVGPSGSGKTTLLNLIAGLILPDSGQIIVGGRDMTALSTRARRSLRAEKIGFVFQDFALLDYLDARDNILYAHRISGTLKLNAAVRARAAYLANAMNIADRLDHHPPALSQGERQRVAICRALLATPKVILSDEATGNLDPDNKALILDLLFTQTKESGAALVAVTHDHAHLSRFDRVIDFAEFRKKPR